jgi:hypothetical protein
MITVTMFDHVLDGTIDIVKLLRLRLDGLHRILHNHY